MQIKVIFIWMRVPYTFFVTREWAFLFCVKREWEFIFSVVCESIFFRPWETGFRFFRDPWNVHLLSRDFWINDFAGIIFHFFGDFSLIKARKLRQTRCKTSPFTELAEGGLRTNHRDSNLKGLEYAIVDKILETNLHFWRYFAHFRREYSLFRLTSPPHNVENYYLQFLLTDFQHCIGGRQVIRF